MDRKRTLLWLVLFFGIAFVVACNLPSPATPSPVSGGAGLQVGVTATGEANHTISETGEGASAPSNTDGSETVFIPGGTFLMGSALGDADAKADEMPQHQVTVTGFYIYRHEVTNGMYAECVAAGGCAPAEVLGTGSASHGADPAYANYPVVGVTWKMAHDYCAWAGGRLPTEAEWELAARGTDGLRYPWGDEAPSCDRANFAGCQSPPDTMAVGSLALGNSPYDLWDMAGNVWEWVQDWYAPDYYASSPADNPLGPDAPPDPMRPRKVARGGGLFSRPENLRTTARLGINPYRVYEDVGFRCVAAPQPTLPRGYADVEEGREEGASAHAEGGSRAEEPAEHDPPTPHVLASCPLSDGTMSVVVAFLENGEYMSNESVTVEGEDFDCHSEWRDSVYTLVCHGPAPAGYPETPEFLGVAITFEYQDDTMTEARRWTWTLGAGHPSADECPADMPDVRVRDSARCLEGGAASVTFHAEPPVTWHGILLLPDGTALDHCTRMTANDTTCTFIPDFGPHFYRFSLHGLVDGSGAAVVGVSGVFLDCSPHVHWSRFDLTEVACLNETDIYVVFDTHNEDVTPDAGYRYNMNTAPFSCSAVAGRPGRVLCSIRLSAAPDPLMFCLAPPGGDPYCVTFDEFAGLLPATCASPPPPCSSYTDQTSCESNGCVWLKNDTCHE